jgi:hypothetical protein
VVSFPLLPVYTLGKPPVPIVPLEGRVGSGAGLDAMEKRKSLYLFFESKPDSSAIQLLA